MSSSSAARLLDPLAAPEATFPDTGVSVLTVPRRERIAPDVTAIGAAEAVAIVRAGGFIAAIESVASELAEGTVVEQEPPAGERLEREGVITLRLATPPLDPVQLSSENDAGLSSEQAARTAGPDDTEEWFQALAPSRPNTPSGVTASKRRRKHRRVTPPARERVLELGPAPSAGPNERAGTVSFRQCTRRQTGLWPSLVSRIWAVAPLLTELQWRRASALLAAVLLVALLGTRLFASGDRRVQTAHPRALARTVRAYAPAGEPVSAGEPFAHRRTRRSPQLRAGRSEMHNRTRARRRTTARVALIAARPAHHADADATPVTPQAPSAGGQFAYLGQ